LKKKLEKLLSDLKVFLPDTEANVSAIDHLKQELKKTDSVPLSKESKSLGKPDIADDYIVALYSDGACRGNPGPGGWGVLAQNNNGDVLFESCGFERDTTNNRMELSGAIESLRQLKNLYKEEGRGEQVLGERILLYSDSKYVVDGIQKWVPGWKKRGWKKADKKTPENLDLWQDLDLLFSEFTNLEFRWVKGHSGHPQNERCDELVNIAIDQNLL